MHILKKKENSILERKSSSRRLLQLDGGKELMKQGSQSSWRSSPDLTVKNRKRISNYLRNIEGFGRSLTLNKDDGMCYFQYKKFVIVIEVPKNEKGYFYIYTMVYQISPTDDRSAVMQEALKMNYMHQGTRGACIGLEGDEVNLCYSAQISGLSRDDFADRLRDFMQTAVEANKRLESSQLR